MLDEFIWGKVSRISPEAPVPIVNVTGESYYPGGAANVARNLREFTAHVAIMGLAGADAAGDRLVGLLAEAGIDTAAVQRDPALPPSSRPASSRATSRWSAWTASARRPSPPRKPRAPSTPSTPVPIRRRHRRRRLRQGLRHPAAGRPPLPPVARHGKILADRSPPAHVALLVGVTAIKPNRAEAFLAAGMPLSEPVVPVLDDRALLEVARRLRRPLAGANLLITLGEHGMLLFAGDALPTTRPRVPRTVFDVSGAGDTAIAVLTLGLAAGATPAEAADLANRASGIAVGKLGTATVSMSELQASLV